MKKQIAEIEAEEARKQKEALSAQKQARKDKLMFWKKKSNEATTESSSTETSSETTDNEKSSEEK